MHVDNARAHAGYNQWMNDKLYGLAAELSDEERMRDVGAFFGSLHETLHHILLADRIWLSRFEGTTLTQDPSLANDFDKLRAARKIEDERILRFASALTESAMTADFSYKNMRGDPFTHPLWWAVSHAFNHETHHRGQATTLLMQLGKDPGVTDLIAFLRLHPPTK
ncbi:MAG: DinB family protein [Polyangiaceae bacterium]